MTKRSITHSEPDQERNREAVRRYTHKTRYGLTEIEYDRLLEKGQGRCMACGQLPTGKKGLHVDHDHKTGKIRGLLCHQCNIALGMAGDNPKRLLMLYSYLRLNA